MKIAVIAAIGRNGELGKEGKLPWNIKEDLQYFKKVTEGNVVVMGRKTYESIGKALPNRTVIIVTTQTDYIANDCLVMHSIAEVIKYSYQNKVSNLYVAGGGEMYKHFLPIADLLYLTRVFYDFDADTYFPEVALEEWKLVSKRLGKEAYGYEYCFEVYSK